MKVIIAGSRRITNMEHVRKAVSDSGFPITEVVSGTALGVDRLGELWAEENNIPVKPFKPKWDEYGRGAGHIRNAEMAKHADALIAVWNGVSPGTNNMIDMANKMKMPVYVYVIKRGAEDGE